MTKDFSIIPVDESNLEQAAIIHAESWRESHKEICSPAFIEKHTTQHQMEYLRGEIAQGKEVFLLLSPEPVGVISVWEDLIENLYVLPSEQGKGYGTQLLYFAQTKCASPNLWVLSSNIKALQFYERRGYTFTGAEQILNERLKELEMKKEKE